MAEEYTIIDRESEQSVKLEFTGVFAGQNITWHASIKTLYACYQDQPGYKADSKCISEWHQFIDISCYDNAYQVEIGLNLKQIDKPAIKRAIIMMRKYKRLHLGRHEYGEAILFDTDIG